MFTDKWTFFPKLRLADSKSQWTGEEQSFSLTVSDYGKAAFLLKINNILIYFTANKEQIIK